jgi:transposase
LGARCYRFNKRFGKTLKIQHFRDMYANAKVTRKVMRSRLGRPKLKLPLIQEVELEQVRQRLREQRRLGYEVFQLDECLFHADSKVPKTWSSKREPILTRGKYCNKPVIVVCGAISPLRGRIYFKYGIRSFNSFDMVDMFKEVRGHSRRHAKLSCWMDNASYHKSPMVRDECKVGKSDILMEFNRPFRPDLNGIEYAWHHIKKVYRDRIAWFKGNGVDFDHMELVKSIIDATPNDIFINAAVRGEINIEKAKPVDRLFWEVVPHFDWVEHAKALIEMNKPSGLVNRARFQETDSGDSQVEN